LKQNFHQIIQKLTPAIVPISKKIPILNTLQDSRSKLQHNKE